MAGRPDRSRSCRPSLQPRQAIGAAQFVPPGRCLVLVTEDASALWITSWPFAAYVKHRWAGAWVCTCFRRESGDALASDLIRAAVAATRWRWTAPELGMVTFVDASKVKRKRDPGRCFARAGFEPVGETVGGLLAFRMSPENMPPAEMPIGGARDLFLAAVD